MSLYLVWGLVFLCRFYSLQGCGVIVFRCYFGRKIRGLICFYFRLKLVNNEFSFRKKLLWVCILLMLSLGLLSIMLLLNLVSIVCGSDSHSVTWFIASLCSFFVRFLHNRSVLLVDPEVLCELGLVQKKRKCWKVHIFRIYMCMIILKMGYKSYVSDFLFSISIVFIYYFCCYKWGR